MQLKKIFSIIIITTLMISGVSIMAASTTAIPRPQSTKQPMPTPQSTTQTVNSIVAIANNEVITATQLNNQLKRTTLGLKKQNVAIPPYRELRKAVLNQLIDQSLKLQLAKQQGLSASKAEINGTMRTLAQHAGISLSQWETHMQSLGYNKSQLIKMIQDQLTVNKVQQLAVGHNMKPNSAVAQRIYQQLKQGFQKSVQYHLVDYLFPLPSNATTEQTHSAKTAATTALKQLKNKNTDIQGAERHDFGWQSADKIPDLFLQKISSHKAGDIIGPFNAGNGFHVLEIMGFHGSNAKAPTIEQARAIAMQQQFIQELATWIKQLRKTAYVKIIQAD